MPGQRFREEFRDTHHSHVLVWTALSEMPERPSHHSPPPRPVRTVFHQCPAVAWLQAIGRVTGRQGGQPPSPPRASVLGHTAWWSLNVNCLGSVMMQPQALLQVDTAVRAPRNPEKRKSGPEEPRRSLEGPARNVFAVAQVILSSPWTLPAAVP